jgi:cation transport ATPase
MSSAAPIRFSIRLGRTQRWLTYVALIGVTISGLLWLLSHEVFNAGFADAERQLLIVHGVSAAAAMLIIGALIPVHMRLAWRARRNLRTGVSLLVFMGVLAISGLALYYGGESYREPVRWAHIAIGVLAALALPTHILLGRATRTASTTN